MKSILTEAKAFPRASPVCELPAAFPLVPGQFKKGKSSRISVDKHAFLALDPYFKVFY